MPNEQNGQNVGKVIEIKGVVIDAVFPDILPEINNALRIRVNPDKSSCARTSASSFSSTISSAPFPRSKTCAWPPRYGAAASRR